MYQELPETRSRKVALKNLATLEQIVSSAESLESVDDLLEYGQGLSRWRVWWNEKKHSLLVAQLEKATSIIERTQIKIRDAPSYKAIVLLYELEQEMAVSGEFSQQLMKLLANEVESHLGLVPSNQDLRKIAGALKSLPSRPYKSGAFQDWGVHALFPARLRAEVKQRCENHKEREEFTDLADKEIRKACYQENERLKASIPVYWFRISMLHAIENHRLGVFDNGDILANIYEPEKHFLPWTTFGMVMQELSQRGAVLEKDIHAELHVHRKLREIGTIVLPNFTDRLSMLLAILRSQAKIVDDLKLKLLAAAVSVFVAVIPTVLCHYIRDEEECELTTST